MDQTTINRLIENIERLLQQAQQHWSNGDSDEMRQSVATAAAVFQQIRQSCEPPAWLEEKLRAAFQSFGFNDREIEQQLSVPGAPASRWKREGKVTKSDLSGYTPGGADHDSNPRGSTTGKHQDGKAAKRRSFDREGGDQRRDYPRKKPSNWGKGPYPPPYLPIPECNADNDDDSLPGTDGSSEIAQQAALHTEGGTMTVQEQFDAVTQLARDAENTGGKYPLAMLERIANAGFPPAQYALASWYLHGCHVPKKDLTRAADLLQNAADAGFPPAEHDLAICYEQGSGVILNPVTAFKYYLRAANNGDLDGQREVARCFFFGIGTAEDHLTSAKWYAIAARRGDPESQFALGRALELGDGVARDHDQALECYRRAAAQGHESAIDALSDLEKSGKDDHSEGGLADV